MIEPGSKLQRGWNAVRRPLAAVALCGMLAVSLQGCLGLAVGGAVMGTLAATDRRTLGAQTEDKAIALKAIDRVANVPGANSNHVNVTSFNRKVLLTGEVHDEQAKAAVEREVAGIAGVQSIVNELTVAGASSFTARSNDSLLTGKVKASFVDDKVIYANSIKVVTERSIVYLMGRVTPAEGARAASIASGVSGVQKVIKVFEYITDAELQDLTAKPETQASK
ncbi:MAG TPA: BON domain-containing protein [Burkholderiaceae bacterium]|nr:BON domain-containing protein [Burkholderiaceae bacterium]